MSCNSIWVDKRAIIVYKTIINMVSEVHRLILEELGYLPEGPDRVFLKREQSRFAKHLAGPKEKPIAREDLSLVEAQVRLNKMIQEDNARHPALSKKKEGENINRMNESAEDSIARLLPAEWWRFNRVLNDLAQIKIQTKDQLAALDKDIIMSGYERRKLLKNSRGYGPAIGERTVPFILAMRDLAMAEVRDKTLSTSNPPQIKITI